LVLHKVSAIHRTQVEDNKINQKVAKKLLEREHFKVDVYDNGLNMILQALETNNAMLTTLQTYCQVCWLCTPTKRILASGMQS
jgi:CheY-like chemotaxis protein